MDINPLDMAVSADDAPQGAKASRLNPAVAIAVALLATFMGLCKVKDDNIVQGMQQAQADKIDHWAFYQARNLREEVARATLVQLRLQAAEKPAARQADYNAAIAQYEKLAWSAPACSLSSSFLVAWSWASFSYWAMAAL